MLPLTKENQEPDTAAEHLIAVVVMIAVIAVIAVLIDQYRSGTLYHQSTAPPLIKYLQYTTISSVHNHSP